MTADRVLSDKAEALVAAVDADRLAQAVALQTVITVLTGHEPQWSDARRMAERLAQDAPVGTGWIAREVVQLLRERETAATQDHEDGWRAFWAAYPRKQAKQAAESVWRRLKPTPALAATITAAVRRQAQSEEWRKDGGRFIPHAATYLRGRRWDDAPGPGVVPDGPSVGDLERARTLELLRERLHLLDGPEAGDRA